jgi:hypothetical protein
MTKRTMKDLHRAIYCELTGSEELGQLMFAAFLTECLPIVPGANPAALDQEISEEEYQAGVLQIRKEMPHYRRFLLAYEPPPQVEEFWEKQARKNGNN